MLAPPAAVADAVTGTELLTVTLAPFAGETSATLGGALTEISNGADVVLAPLLSYATAVIV
jgi:hypothetical protein